MRNMRDMRESDRERESHTDFQEIAPTFDVKYGMWKGKFEPQECVRPLDVMS